MRTHCFWNLATNGLKAMPEGGTLTVALGRSKPGLVELRFSDSGFGMDPESQANYFQPFNSSFREGTGLGAAIVYRLVEEHGGRIRIDSREGRGTSVSVLLPEVQAASATLKAAGGQR